MSEVERPRGLRIVDRYGITHHLDHLLELLPPRASGMIMWRLRLPDDIDLPNEGGHLTVEFIPAHQGIDVELPYGIEE